MVVAIFWLLAYLLVVGLAAGWFAWILLGKSKALTKGGRPNFTLLLGLGVAGSFVAGVAIGLIVGDGLALRPSGMIASIVGAIAVEAIYLGIRSRRNR